MTQKFEKLKTLLMELFQLDQPELDFGIYRILHAKSGEVTKFLDTELLPQVRTAFEVYRPADKAALRTELDRVITGVRAAGMDPEQAPKVKELRAQLESSVDIDALEASVFDHLYSFFRRYYHEGDFLSRRVYKPGVYAIPYEGEEVHLHWANKDQYYIKSSEHLRDYAFRMRPNEAKAPMRVHFKLVDASEGEHGNVKAAEGKEREFVLASEPCWAVEQAELTLRFEYRAPRVDDWPEPERAKKSKPPAQKDLIAIAVARLLALTDKDLAPWIRELSSLAPTESHPQRTTLAKHLDQYTKTNKFDYFIHKDLGGFLRRELDFYIKNEVMHLDDIEKDTAPKVEEYLSKIRVLRRIAGKLIDFLAQLEDFQKKMRLKKKFVVETSWCVRVGVIPSEFHAEIAANDAQREEWVKLCAIDEIRADTSGPGYTKPLTAAFLGEYSSLVLDTRHFSAEFTSRLLNALGAIDAQTDGVLVHSENYQALEMMQARYRKQIDCTYIDPPYNTGNDGFAYKDSYQHSSWITMLLERTGASERLLSNAGTMFVSLDDNEAAAVTLGMASTSRLRHVTNIIWQKVDSPNDNKVALTPDHEYVLCFSADESLQQLRPMYAPDILEAYRKDKATGQLSRDRLLKKNGANSLRSDRPTMYYPIQGPDGAEVYPTHDDGVEARWSLGQPAVQALQEAGTLVWKRREVNGLERWEPYTREFAPDIPTRPYPTIWLDVKTMRQAKAQIRALLASEVSFQTIKPTQLIESALRLAGLDGGLVLDYFAGSGTTAHAVINLNRETGGGGKFLLVEMSDGPTRVHG